jgi:hypothetical protein
MDPTITTACERKQAPARAHTIFCHAKKKKKKKKHRTKKGRDDSIVGRAALAGVTNARGASVLTYATHGLRWVYRFI